MPCAETDDSVSANTSSRASRTVADSANVSFLYETGLPTRYYSPKSDVRMDLLRPSDTVTHCPYKGRASHLSAQLDTESVADIAWTYPTPLPESERVAGLVSFYDDKVTITVDGEPPSDVHHDLTVRRG